MNYRKRGQFNFITEGINEEDKIPPMIIHTLIENGMTHGYENKNTGYFKLIRKEFPGGIQYSLFNDSHLVNSEFKEGTGYKYIRARLEESYMDKWKLDYKPVENGWEVIFEIHKN
jgi:LytS/YehU family sensor histidine kinase